MIRCVLIAEDEAEDVFEFATEAEFEAFRDGVCRGANLYGAGSCGVYREADLAGLDPERYGRAIAAGYRMLRIP